MVKAKTAIILSLGTSPLAQLAELIDDDDKTAKQLWDALAKLHTTSNAQLIINLQHELENLSYKDGEVREKHLEIFNDIIGKLESYDKKVEYNESKLIRTLPESFEPFAMITNSVGMSFDKLLVAIEGEISRRKRHKISSVNISNPTAAAAVDSKTQIPSPHGGIGKKKKGPCFVCGKLGHYAFDCWHKQDGYQRTGRRSSFFRGRGRTRGRGGRGRFRYHDRYTRGYGNPHFQPVPNTTWPHTQNQNTSPVPHNGGSNSGHSINGAAQYASNNFGIPQPSQFSNPSSRDRSFGFMASIKFRSSVAMCDEKKSTNALIDSGGSHHFFTQGPPSYLIESGCRRCSVGLRRLDNRCNGNCVHST